MNKIPENCRECEHARTCRAPHYGGSTCKHGEEINRRTVDRFLAGKEEDTKT